MHESTATQLVSHLGLDFVDLLLTIDYARKPLVFLSDIFFLKWHGSNVFRIFVYSKAVQINQLEFFPKEILTFIFLFIDLCIYLISFFNSCFV